MGVAPAPALTASTHFHARKEKQGPLRIPRAEKARQEPARQAERIEAQRAANARRAEAMRAEARHEEAKREEARNAEARREEARRKEARRKEAKRKAEAKKSEAQRKAEERRAAVLARMAGLLRLFGAREAFKAHQGRVHQALAEYERRLQMRVRARRLFGALVRRRMAKLARMQQLLRRLGGRHSWRLGAMAELHQRRVERRVRRALRRLSRFVHSAGARSTSITVQPFAFMRSKGLTVT